MDTDQLRHWIQSALRTKLACSRSLIEMTDYRGVAMWWWADFSFDADIKELLRRGSGQTSTTGRSDVLFAQSRIPPWVSTIYRKGVVLKSLIFNLTLLELSRFILFLFQTKRISPCCSEKRRKILFTAEDIEWRPLRDENTARTRKSDAFFDSMLRRLVERYDCVGVYPVWRESSVRALLMRIVIVAEKLRSWYVQQKPFELYWSIRAYEAERDAFEHFNTVWSDLLHDTKFNEICDYARKNIDTRIVSMLEYHFLHTFPVAVRNIVMAEHMIEQENPDLILIEEEYGVPFERALVVGAKRRGVPTLAVQHGDIHACHSGYMNLRGEVSPDGTVKSPFCPIPDKTAVYGPYHRDLLIDVGYPEGSLEVTGQPRYDRLHRAHKLYFRDAFQSRHGIGPGQRIVLWATQSHAFSVQENVDLMTAVFGTMQEINGATLVIKQHPGEREMHTRLISERLADYNIRVVMTPKTSDTFEQLFVSDIVLTTYSTTAAEAVALGKPVIILNLRGKPESTDYVAEGVAVEVRKKGELAPAIAELLRNPSKLSSNRERFIERYLYRIDGDATRRILEIISLMTGEPRGMNE